MGFGHWVQTLGFGSGQQVKEWMGSVRRLRVANTSERQLRRPYALTWAGLFAERLSRAFWQVWSFALFVLAGHGFGLWAQIPQGYALPVALVLTGLGGLLLVQGWRRYRHPKPADVHQRLDEQFPDRPWAALADQQALGTSDAQSVALWSVHQGRMLARAAGSVPQKPDLRLASRDPNALRYIALLAFVTALIFGQFGRPNALINLGDGTGQFAGGPSWEGWANPPAYSGKPALYLNDQTADVLSLPKDTKIKLRLYGDSGELTVVESFSGQSAANGAQIKSQDYVVKSSGMLEIKGPGGRVWEIVMIPDAPPTVAFDGKIQRKGDGRFSQGFAAKDDFGVTRGRAAIALDMSRVDRRYGLELEPEMPLALSLDLTVSKTKNKTDFKGKLVDDLSKSLLSNMAVTLTLQVTDAAGQTGSTAAEPMILPGRRFFDPLAAALIEMRRDLMWNSANAPRVAQVMKAVLWRPATLIRDETAYLRLKVALGRLDAAGPSLSPAMRDEMAEELWQIALVLEEGDLQSAKERLERAQDRLEEAIRRGADPSEIAELMEEMREALDDYMEKLAEDQKDEGREDQITEDQPPGMNMSYDQLQQMMDQLQKLMEEGKTAEAADLMAKIREFMDNMKLAEGQGGSGGPRGKAMQQLGEQLRNQRDLSDDSFRSLNGQSGPSQGTPEGENGTQEPDLDQGSDEMPPLDDGQNPGQGNEGAEKEDGQSDNGRDQNGAGSLAQRQAEIRREIERLREGDLPGKGNQSGDDGRRKLDEAGRAMEEAEEALENGDLSGALDRQAEAMKSLREGIGDLNRAQQEEAQQAGQDPAQRGGEGQEPGKGRDPLGRPGSDTMTNGSDDNLKLGDDIRRKADALLDEIRRRSGEQSRPEGERDYLKRLLDLF